MLRRSFIYTCLASLILPALSLPDVAAPAVLKWRVNEEVLVNGKFYELRCTDFYDLDSAQACALEKIMQESADPAEGVDSTVTITPL